MCGRGGRAQKIESKRSLDPSGSSSQRAKKRRTVSRGTKKKKVETERLSDNYQHHEALYILGKSPVESDDKEYQDTESARLSLFFKQVPPNDHRDILPAELLIKIIKYSVELSDNPIFQLLNCSQVCEYWRQIVLYTSDLWTALNLTNLLPTKSTVKTLEKLLELNPNIAHNIRDISLDGWKLDSTVLPLLNSIFQHQKVKQITLKAVTTTNKKQFFSTISKTAGALESLVINDSKELLNNSQGWIVEQINNHGRKFKKLDLNLSLQSISPALFKAICSPSCANLRILDLSTGVYINQGNAGLDALLLAENLPDLEILRCAVTSFKRVLNPPQRYGLHRLRELSLPTLVRDQDRDDALLGTLAYGSEQLEYLDIRGCVMSSHALISLPSSKINNLHLDDIPSHIYEYREYKDIVEKWASSLECLSLLRVNDKEVVSKCLEIIAKEPRPKLRAIDLSGSEVSLEHLNLFLRACENLEAINLNACRSLPRGFKGSYSSNMRSNRLSIGTLKSKIKAELKCGR